MRVAPKLRFSHGPGFFVWVVWALMLLAALAYVRTYGSNVPSWDDWDIVPAVTGEQPITLDWLWSQHNEHRVLLPRLVMLALNRLITIDFRVEMYFDVLAMAALALAMMLVARRLRGRVSYTDAFFPILLLNWGQAANFLWGWQLQFFSSAVLAGAILLIIVRTGAGLELGAAAVSAGALAILLPLCGANGLGMAPALVLWPLVSGVTVWRSGDARARRRGLLAMAFGLVALLLTAFYFVGYEPVPYHPKSTGPLATLKTSAQFLTIGFGPAVRGIWPLSGLLVLVLLSFGAARVVLAWRKQPDERPRTSGLFLFFAAMGSLALGLGLGRDGFETRYVTLAAPLWCCVYFVAALYAPPVLGQRMRMLLLVLAGLALWPNTRFGLAYGADLRQQLGGFERNMAAGVPSYRLICRYGDYLHPHHDVPTDYLPMLRRHGVGGYRRLRSDPPFQEIRVPLPVASDTSTGKDGAGRRGGDFLNFTLPKDTYACGIRLRYSHSSSERATPYVAIYWKRGEHADFSGDRYKKYSPTGDHANWERGAWTRLNDVETTMTVWVCDTIKDLRVWADVRPAEFRISELIVLTPRGNDAQ